MERNARILACICTLLGSAWVSAQTALADTAAEPKHSSACVQWSTEVIFDGYAYDYWVTLVNGCDRPMTCVVAADLNPQSLAVNLNVREQNSVVIFRDTAEHEVKVTVDCSARR